MITAHTKQWCGPSALSIITGRPYANAVRAIEWTTGRKFRVSTKWGTLLNVLRLWRVEFEIVRLSSRRSVAKIANEYRSKLLLVRVGNHFIVLLDGEYYDQHHFDGAPSNTLRKMVSHVAIIP